jgi:hypothetical protein
VVGGGIRPVLSRIYDDASAALRTRLSAWTVADVVSSIDAAR